MYIKTKKNNLFMLNGSGIFHNTKSKIKPLSNYDMISIMDEREGNNDIVFIGVFSRNDLPKNLLDNQSLILNLDGYDGLGTHWVCIYNKDPEYVEYFDSYGMAPSEESIKYMRTTNKLIKYSTNQIQSFNSILCGYYCMYYINERDNGFNMYDIIYRFDTINGVEDTNNGKIIIDYFNLQE